MIRGCGALPHAPAGRSSPCTPGTSDGRANRRPGCLQRESQTFHGYGEQNALTGDK